MMPAKHLLAPLARRMRYGRLGFVRRRVVELNNICELRRLFGWCEAPPVTDPHFREVKGVEDVNQRRLRDAEVLATVARNCGARTCVEIGTASGHATAVIAENAATSNVYTVNIPPDDIVHGKGGCLTTYAPSESDIGSYYRAKGLTNVTQILANSAEWKPDVGQVDLAFIDGCHDTGYVYNDSNKLLPHIRSGGFMLWHDFNPALVDTFPWIRCVCEGVNRLGVRGLLAGRILHVRDSWIGIYRVP
jgi:hypothetical protein